MMAELTRGANRHEIIMFGVAFLTLLSLAYVMQRSQLQHVGDGVQQFRLRGVDEPAGYVPLKLLELNVYSMSDFEATRDRRDPPFWSCQAQGHPCNNTDRWGPCYAPPLKTDWSKQVDAIRSNNRTPVYHDKLDSLNTKEDLAGYCNPGFLIIGAGKCGTSSLYHYITSHPRVLPASEKQIHYFRYYFDNSMKWYLRHFPTAISFLASGALMTGEASPGYLPYPDVVNRVRATMQGPRIIVIGRNPLERAYSSYKYNYVEPTLDELMKGRIPHIRAGQNESVYQQYLFSFQDLVEAELRHLRRCMDPATGKAVLEAREQWSRYAWARDEIARRNRTGMSPMVDLDGFCYGRGNKTVPREQWADLLARYPDKVITSRNLHLKQALVGRSLYFAPLEWWYAGISKDDIFFMCTEEMQEFSGEPMLRLSRFLGLPDYNFSAVLQEGAFNVGGHRGYDEEVSWQEISNETIGKGDIPLSEEVRREFQDFVRPYNERLFNLVGRRCDWS